MKTLTEFHAPHLKNASKVKQELVTSGKTTEELPAALGETLKLEGDRLTWIQSSLEIVGNKLEDLKRVIVFTLQENEKAPQGAIQKGEQYFLAEYYPPLVKEKEKGPFKKDRHEGKRKGKGKGGRDRTGGQQKRPSGPHQPGQISAVGPSQPGSGEGQTRKPFVRRPPRNFRKPESPTEGQGQQGAAPQPSSAGQAAAVSSGPKLSVIVPKKS